MTFKNNKNKHMKKALTLIAVFAILFAVSKLFIQGKSPDNTKQNKETNLVDLLTGGKWIDKSEGYKISNESEDTKERYKTFTFKKDKTFALDSAKQKYSGTWHISENKIILEFNDKEIVHLYKNKDPNSMSNDYVTENEILSLGIKTIYCKLAGSKNGYFSYPLNCTRFNLVLF